MVEINVVAPVNPLARVLCLFFASIAALATGVDAAASCSVPPTVTVSVSGNADGVVSGTVAFDFPDTTDSSQRILRISSVRAGAGGGYDLGEFRPVSASGTQPFVQILSCEASGTYIYTAKAISCGTLSKTDTDDYALTTEPTVSISYEGPDDLGHGTVTVHYNFPNTSDASQRTLTHEMFFPNGGSYGGLPIHPETREGDLSIPFNMLCVPDGTYTHKITLHHCNGTEKDDTDEAVVNAEPTISVTTEPVDANGDVLVNLEYGFPGTDTASQRYLEPGLDTPSGGVLFQGFHPESQYDTYSFKWNVACAIGQYTFRGLVRSCGGQTAQAGKPVTLTPTPTVSLSYSKPNGGIASVSYSFPNSSSPSQRLLELYADDAYAGSYQAPSPSGVWPVTVGTCWEKLRVLAVACAQSNNANFTAEDELENPDKDNEPITVNLLSLGGGQIEATVVWSDVIVGGTINVRLQDWIDGNGNAIPGHLLHTFQAATANGSQVFTFPAVARQMSVVATAPTVCGIATDDDSIDCACEKNTATNEPVYLNDGNMRLTDGEPLPPIGGHGLSRTYDSGEGIGGLFGRGWTTLFERRLIAHGDGAISIVTETNEVVTFRLSGGAFVQTWPGAARSVGTLAYNSGFATYTYRAPGSTEVAIFRASDGRLVILRNAAKATEATIAYDAQGRPATFTDTVNETAWNLTINSERRITSIAVAGHPELAWSYSYDVDGNLLTVLAPGGAPWRTYEYVAGLMTASHDALGNLIESHTYDSAGHAISSTGNVDEIANIEFDLPGTMAGERMTRVTYRTGAVGEYLHRPIGGAWRPVQVSSGCNSCGARDATYVRDFRGRVVREQGADGYITVTAYEDDDVLSEEGSLKPAGCDPQTDAQHCRLDTDALAIATLEPTSATVLINYEHGDPLWPDRVTATTRRSVLSPAGVVGEERIYHPLTGAVTASSITGWTGANPVNVTRAMQTTLYDADRAPAFNPGGTFLSAWMALPQPAYLQKLVDGSRTDAQDVTAFVYYPIDASVPALLRGRLAATKNAVGVLMHYDQYDVFGDVLRMVDANGVATERTYDALGRPVTTTTKGVSGCNTTVDPLCATDLTTAQTYAPSAGPLQFQERAGGGVTAYTYDARGRVQTISRGPVENDLRERIETTYDTLTGKKSLERTLAYEGAAWVEKTRQSFAYDAQSRLQAVTHADGAAVHYTYDAEGRVSTMRDENHAAPNTSYAYDPAGRVASVTQALAGVPNGGIITHYTYDIAGDLTSVTDPNGNVTTYVYDDFGQLLRQQSPVTETTTYAYDSAGNLMQTIDANGATTARTYDAANRILTAVSSRGSDTESVTWTYDGATTGAYGHGRVAAMEDPSGTTTYAYDRRGLLRQEAHAIWDMQYVQIYAYDADGNRKTIGYPSGRVVTYAFDDAGRPLTASGTLGAQTTSYVTAATYLPFGPLKSLALGNGTTETRTYNSRYLPLTNTLKAGTTTLAQYTYTTDPAGNITAIADGTSATYNRTFGYDDLNRLTSANTGSALWGSGSYTYDRMGNMLSATLGATSRTFTHQGTTPKINTATDLDSAMSYDAAGNELKSPAGDPEGGAPPAAYSPRNLLQSQFVREYDRCLEETGSPCILPDPVQIWLSNVYDGRNVLVLSFDDVISSSISSQPPQPRLYFYTPELNMLNVTSRSTNRTADVIWFGSRPVADHSTTAVRYTFTDHLGTPILQTSANASIVWRAEHEPFGNIYQLRAGTAADDQPLRFPGQQVAFTTDAGEENYNIFRGYRAGWGRYTQADPIGLRGGSNLYSYAASNPARYVDPRGLVKVVKTPTTEFGFDRDAVVSACGGLNVNGCVLGLTKPVSCDCYCNGVAWQARVTVSSQYIVYYAVGLKDIPAEQIRAAEWQHVSELEAIDASTIADAEGFEMYAFPSKLACKAGCAAFKLNDKLKRWKNLAIDIVKGHSVE